MAKILGPIEHGYLIERFPPDNPTGFMVRHWIQPALLVNDGGYAWKDVPPRMDSRPAATMAQARDLIPLSARMAHAQPPAELFPNVIGYWYITDEAST